MVRSLHADSPADSLRGSTWRRVDGSELSALCALLPVLQISCMSAAPKVTTAHFNASTSPFQMMFKVG